MKPKLTQIQKDRLNKLINSEDTHNVEGNDTAFTGWLQSGIEIVFDIVDVDNSEKSKMAILVVNIDSFLDSLAVNDLPLDISKFQRVSSVAPITEDKDMPTYKNVNPLKSIILENIHGLRNKTLDIETAREISNQVETLVEIGKAELMYMRQLDSMK